MPPRLFASRNALPPEGAARLRPGGAGSAPGAWMEQLPPRSRTACRFLPPEGAAAPVARQSRFHGPCWGEDSPSYSLSLRERAGVRAPRLRFHGLALDIPTLTPTLSRQREREKNPRRSQHSDKGFSCSLSLRERAGVRALRLRFLPPEGAAGGYGPHGCSLRVTPCPPRGPLRLWPGKAGSAAPARLKSPHGCSLRVTPCSPRGLLRLRSGGASPAALAGVKTPRFAPSPSGRGLG